MALAGLALFLLTGSGTWWHVSRRLTDQQLEPRFRELTCLAPEPPTELKVARFQ